MQNLLNEEKNIRVLFVGAHTDDEVNSAGTLARFLENKNEVFFLVFSFCEESSRNLGYAEDILESEFDCSLKTIGIKKENVYTNRFPVRNFPQYRQAILDKLIRIERDIKPDLVLIPSSVDVHQDHYVLLEEGRRAFKHCTILGYESPKSPVSSYHICYVRLNSNHFQTKLACLNCYKSQTVRDSMRAEVKTSLTKLRGMQAGCKWAEAFEVVRWIMK